MFQKLAFLKFGTIKKEMKQTTHIQSKEFVADDAHLQYDYWLHLRAI